VRFAVELRRRVVVLRPPRFAVVRFAVVRFFVRFAVVRFAVVRFAVVLRRVVERFAVVFLRPALLRPVLARRRVVFWPPLPVDIEPLIGDGGGGVGLAGMGVGQTEPGSFCADQSVPWSSCMVPPQKSVERSRDAYRIPLGIASAATADRSSRMKRMEIVEQDSAQEWRPWEPPIWLIALGLTAALLVGLVVSGRIADPRTAESPSPTPCVPTAITQVGGASYIWSFCPNP
jgi:hypothetical protein